MLLPRLSAGRIWTHKNVLRQDIPNSHTDFTANAFHQDFTLFGLPANHVILGVKIAVLSDFDAGQSNFAYLYVGQSSVFPTPNGTINGNFVSNVNNCYGYHQLTVPSGSDETYQYGSFRWFSLSAPGGNVSDAHCLPQRIDAHDVIARVVVQGNNSVRVNLITTGIVEITTQYVAI